MTTIASTTPTHSPTPSSSEDYGESPAFAAWQYTEDATPTPTPAREMKRQAAVDWLSEAFARLSLQADIDRERKRESRKSVAFAEEEKDKKGKEVEETSSTALNSEPIQNPTVVSPPIIKITPPDAVEAASAVFLVDMPGAKAKEGSGR